MSFTALTTTEVATGKPVTNTTQTKIKENFDNLDQRVTTLEGGGSTVYPPIIMRVNGNYSVSWAGVADNYLKTTCNFNLTITGIRLLIDVAGSAGSTEVDIKFKRGAGAWTSLLTTKPKCNYQDGNDYTSANSANGSYAGVLDPTYVDLLSGDLIRLDVTSVQTGSPNGFLIRIDYIKT